MIMNQSKDMTLIHSLILINCHRFDNCSRFSHSMNGFNVLSITNVYFVSCDIGEDEGNEYVLITALDCKERL